MSDNKNLALLVDQLETEIHKTIEKRRDYSTKILTNYAKTLDLKFKTLKSTKYLVDESTSFQTERKTDQNHNILSLIEEPKKLKCSQIKKINHERKEINDALLLLKTIESTKRKNCS